MDFVFFFFFSSRRRHTRCSRDWSSDVCSSDLKYMEVARFAMDFAAKEFKSRAKILVAKPGPGLTPDQAAHQILKTFLPRAFRRPVDESDIAPYVDLYKAVRKQGQAFEPAIFFALRGALVSPLFLFRAEP